MSATEAKPGDEARLRIVASDDGNLVGEEIVVGGEVTIGRDDECSITLAETTVSRRHAKVELTPEGLKVTDLNSGNGVWSDGQKIQELVLAPGQRFQVGSTTFECPAPPVEEEPRAAEAQPEAEATVFFNPAEHGTIVIPTVGANEGFLLKVVASGQGDLVGREMPVRRGSAIVGRGEDCTIALADNDISRQHAKIEQLKDGKLRLSDLGSTNGTWLDEQKVTKPVTLEPGQEFRLGHTTRVACWPRAKDKPIFDPGHVDAEGPIVVATPLEHIEEIKRIENEGELVEVGSTQPFLLDDPEIAWYCVAGGVDIFTVTMEGGAPVGTRSHFLGILPGQCCFGIDVAGMGSAFQAVAKPNTKLRKINRARLRELVAIPDTAESVGALLNTWVHGLTRSLTHDVEKPALAEEALKPGEPCSFDGQARVSSEKGVVWIDIWSGSLLFVDMATPVFHSKWVLFPITADSWIQPVGDEFEATVEPRTTAAALADDALWEGLDVFHQVLCECEFINKRLAAVDEFLRLQDKAQHAEAARDAAYDAIGAVLRTEAETPREFLHKGSTEPVLNACAIVGDHLAMEVRSHPGAGEGLTFEEQIAAIASASSFRFRVVGLRGRWWTHDHGPLVGQLEEDGSPVALIPTGPVSYEIVDPTSGSSVAVDDDVAASLAPFGYTLYAPFPEGSLTAMDLVKFGAQGLYREFRTLLFMGIAVGLLGAATPWITGKIIDGAIPQADFNMLLGFGLALLGAAIATSMFKIVQGIATVRIQGKMEARIQSALWDRLMNLPTTFFRRYSAGDLADRAAGIDAIQQLLAGAGIAAILGSLSGLFYVGLMLSYDMRLASVAVVLTLVYVATTMTGNYLQLRHQRVEVTLKGQITGLVLNLITGVTKLRICGAEHHAFRRWADRFSEQRRIAFAIGRIQNTITVFGDVFPIGSSMIIFYVMFSAQTGPEGATLSTGDFVAFNSAYGLFLAAMQALGEASLSMLRVVPIFERIKPIITTPAEIDSSKVYPGKVTGAMELSHVSFRYSEDSPWIMNDLTLSIGAGEFVAFVGGSGCGKSTLMRLLLGFETPQQGSVFYDNMDLSTVDLRMLRQQLGVVLQKSQVMPTDIYRNIVGVGSRPTEDAWEAAEAAGLADDIRGMPMQMHTYISEGGGTLSGGQRQRLMIARAIVNKPNIIFLDEATSALDNRAQAMVTESMDRMEATRIVIAHRLSTIINADKICYLEGGKIAEMGTYQELMEEDGLFADLAKRQMA